MPEKIVNKNETKFLQIMDVNGKVDENLMPNLNENDVKKLFEFMILARTFDEVALKLQREGRMLTFASIRGQEAANVGSAYATSKEDWIFPSFREHGVYVVKGYPLDLAYAYWAGDERGDRVPNGLRFFTVSVPVSTQIPHAVGCAWALKKKKENAAALVYFGDGATSKGDFHEALNFAGVFKLPVVFICQNNQWAISLPRSQQTAAETIAQKAWAYGFPGIQVDGNDIFAVYKATKEALERAKRGEGPTLIECYTYRVEHHTTADDWSRYRDTKEVEEWKKKDPIDRLRKYMQSKGLWSQDYENKIAANAEKKVSEAVKKEESMPPPKPEDIFMFTYAIPPQHLMEQMEELLTRVKSKGES